MSEQGNDSFGSKIGAIMVAAGSAIGLGSIWRFPYIAGENGGGAFVLLYFICIVLLGIPVMLSEFAIGTYTRKGPVKAYAQLSKRWKPLGYNSLIVSTLISGFYYIVAERITIAINITKSIGITHFAVFSKPLRTPRDTTMWVARIKSIV